METYSEASAITGRAGQPAGIRLAESITAAASQQTFYTIRFLVDAGRVQDAYRAYAYFRWLDDSLDGEGLSAAERLQLVRQQADLLTGCYHGDWPEQTTPEEQLLVDLIRGDDEEHSGLQSYLRQMMAVMVFDAKRRGQLVSQAELDQYTGWLAGAVTDAMHHFIGHCCAAPRQPLRTLAVTGAHITHMLRDTFDDVAAGYINLPREYVEGAGLDPRDVTHPLYRAWVMQRVADARLCFEAGRRYLREVESVRCRLAAYAYMARFESVLNLIEQDDYVLRPVYPQRRSLPGTLRMASTLLGGLIQPPQGFGLANPASPAYEGGAK